MPSLRTRRRIEFCDTDMAGIVHFSNFFRFMEAAECEYLRSRGLSVKMDWDDYVIGFPRVSASCDYVSPARFEDVLDVVVTLDRVGSKSVAYTFEFSRADAVIARGKVTSVCCRVGKDNRIESIEIPAAYRARLVSDTTSA